MSRKVSIEFNKGAEGMTYEEFEESNQTEQTQEVGKGCHHGRELLDGTEHGSEEQRQEEQSQQYGSVPYDRSDSDDTNSDEGTWGLLTILVWEGLDEHVSNDEDGRLADGPDNL